MSASLVTQKAIRARLITAISVTSLVSATSILDRNARPNPDPSIIIGEDQAIPGDDIARRTETVFSTLHIWKKEPGLVGVKAIAGAMRAALHSSRLTLDTGFHCGDCRVASMRFLRDPDGETGHGIVNVETIVSEVSA